MKRLTSIFLIINVEKFVAMLSAGEDVEAAVEPVTA